MAQREDERVAVRQCSRHLRRCSEKQRRLLVYEDAGPASVLRLSIRGGSEGSDGGVWFTSTCTGVVAAALARRVVAMRVGHGHGGDPRCVCEASLDQPFELAAQRHTGWLLACPPAAFGLAIVLWISRWKVGHTKRSHQTAMSRRGSLRGQQTQRAPLGSGQHMYSLGDGMGGHDLAYHWVTLKTPASDTTSQPARSSVRSVTMCRGEQQA